MLWAWNEAIVVYYSYNISGILFHTFHVSYNYRDRQETEQPYQHPLTLSISDVDENQPDYDYVINTEMNDKHSLIQLTECPAYRSTAQP